MPVRVNVGAIGLYGFGVLLLYLAGMYFGSFLMLLFYLSLAYPVVSLLLTAAAARRFRFRQSWDQGRPVKGGQASCTLTLVNGSFLPLYRVEIRFAARTPLSAAGGTDLRFFLAPRQEIDQAVTVRFPFRGVYTLGIEAVVIRDFLHFFSFSRRAEPRTFTIYPSIHRIRTLVAGGAGGSGSPVHHHRQVLPDYTLFSHLREYRPGESLKHVAWKKFASRGVPLMREFESVLDNAVSIHLDLRPPASRNGLSMTAAQILTLEDTSIELMVALAHDFLHRGIPLSITAPGSEPLRFFGSRPEHFQDLYGATLAISFRDTYNPGRLQQDGTHGGRARGATFFITHLPDREMLAAVERASVSRDRVYLIYNRAVDHRSGPEKPSPGTLDSLRSRGARILEVRRPEEIREMLARQI
jgi:uncharacterized protein (DUF58 family)